MEYQKKSQKFQQIHNIIQRQLHMRMIKKYLKKDIYLQKKDKKLFIILIIIYNLNIIVYNGISKNNKLVRQYNKSTN